MVPLPSVSTCPRGGRSGRGRLATVHSRPDHAAGRLRDHHATAGRSGQEATGACLVDHVLQLRLRRVLAERAHHSAKLLGRHRAYTRPRRRSAAVVGGQQKRPTQAERASQEATRAIAVLVKERKRLLELRNLLICAARVAAPSASLQLRQAQSLVVRGLWRAPSSPHQSVCPPLLLPAASADNQLQARRHTQRCPTRSRNSEWASRFLSAFLLQRSPLVPVFLSPCLLYP